MNKTVRINLMVSPEEKADIDERARKASLTTSELVRRAVEIYDPDVDMNELRALAEELGGAAERMEKKLDANLAKIAELREQLADTEALKAAAIAEIKATGEEWPFDLPDERGPRSVIAAV